MDLTEKRKVRSPEIDANPVSKFLYLWILPLFRKGSKKDLTIDDLYDRLPEDDASTLGSSLESEWQNQCKMAKLLEKKPSFLRAIIKIFGAKFLFYSFYTFINEIILRTTVPFVLRSMIHSFSEEAKTDKDYKLNQYLYTGALILISLAYALNLHKIYAGLTHLALKCRIACSSLIYRKVLKLSKSGQTQNANMGKLVNLIASDTNCFDRCFFHLNMIFVGPIQLIILVYFLWMELGVSCFAGIGVIVGVLIPFQVIVGRLSAKFRAQVARRTDERGRMMNEMILGIKIIKMYAWEKPFSSLIHGLRKLEIIPIRRAAYLRGTFQSLNFLAKVTIPFFTFIVFVSLGNALTAEKAYFTISIYSIIIIAMAQKIPQAIGQIGEFLVATKRLRDFFLLDELQSKATLPIYQKPDKSNSDKSIVAEFTDLHHQPPKIVLERVTARWTKERSTLENISLSVCDNALVIVTGPVGCGKSSLLSVLISELPINSGKLEIAGRLSYASQEAWVFSGNVRQNILFGLPFDQHRYNSVIHVAALEEDLEQLSNGDLTIVGERGVSLSGGQKARIGLARAIYQKSDIYLMDDPLSAVDATVSRHIFDQCIKNYLEGTLRILITHQVQYLSQADHIIVLNKNGEIMAQGSYDTLLAQNIDFVSLLTEENQDSVDDSTPKTAHKGPKSSNGYLKNGKSETIKINKKPDSKEEKLITGSVTSKTYWEYCKSGNSKLQLIVVLLLFVITQAMQSFTDKWLSLWTNEVSKRSISGSTSGYSDQIYIYVYTAAVTGVVIFISTRSILFFHYCMCISVNLHNRMFRGLIRAPVRFFDTNPSGRIMNRFTKDLNCIDEQLPSSLYNFINVSLGLLGAMSLVISSNYYIAIPAVVMLFGLWKVRKFYVKTARDVKRIESISKSPVFLHVAASVQGLTTIRAQGAQERLIDQFDSLLDISTSPSYLVTMASRWLGIWLDTCLVIFLAIVSFSFILISDSAEVGNVGMAITLTLNLLTSVQWGLRESTETENYMTSVERVIEYCQITPEAPLESDKDKKPPKDWPRDGRIKFRDVTMSYDESNRTEVLKNLNFEIKKKEKIGIVGRTGAGKSSILVALFRLTESEGDILIDDISIKQIGLHDLRKSISIIPQDPVLFSGSMRYNLDPFDQFKDIELWKVLKEVSLGDAVPSLDFTVSDGGSNFSVGQRQLVCLARAILRNNKIIVLDEATANVDHNTDNLIQNEIRKKFAECTIITIAHRLHSVIDNDRILVLDNGFVKEFDTPSNLLENSEGIFSTMISQVGSGAGALRKIATTGAH